MIHLGRTIVEMQLGTWIDRFISLADDLKYCGLERIMLQTSYASPSKILRLSVHAAWILRFMSKMTCHGRMCLSIAASSKRDAPFTCSIAVIYPRDFSFDSFRTG